MSKILIVEDEESIAELEKDYLELSGFEVETEKDGKAGLERVLAEKYDLLILDLIKRSEKKRIFRSSWYRPRRMILIRFVALAWVRMTI